MRKVFSIGGLYVSLIAYSLSACNHKIGQAMKKKYKKEMDYVYAVINEMDRKLDRPIRDLDDVRMIMETLSKIREQEVDMELRIDPIEVSCDDSKLFALVSNWNI